MKHTSLTHQVAAYQKWKNLLIREIARYRNWLETSDLLSEDIERRLQRGFKLLREDDLTIAFVGEFSRGKTELINALFFSGFGQRMLPSQAGRTTMCPTELFYDRQRNASYLRLLPIETRASEAPLSSLMQRPEKWQEFSLDTSNPESMRQILDQVATTKKVTINEANVLGFHDESLDHVPGEAELVLIPAWRHAQISLRDPMLEQGLRILDTPGLNALGSEPELTFSMLPAAHAVIFLLSADAGVTASDMKIWNEYIVTNNADHSAGRFAVLNKIDILWDDLQGDTHTQSSIDRVIDATANHLGLTHNEVIPISAKQGLIAKVKGDEALQKRSQLNDLEHLLSDRILAHKEKLITQTLVNDLVGMLQNSEAILTSRRQQLKEQMQLCEQKKIDPMLMGSLVTKTQDDYDFYNKKLITLRSSRRLMKSQGTILHGLISEERFETHVQNTRKQLEGSWTTMGMYRAMTDLFQSIEADIGNLLGEARLAEKMVKSIYDRYKSDVEASHLHPNPFTIKRSRRELNALKVKAEQFRRDPKTLLSQQQLVIRRFFNTLVSEARTIYSRIIAETLRWPEEALLPILQYTQEQKTLLEKQIKRLKSLARTNRTTREHKEQLNALVLETENQLKEATHIHKVLRRPAPTLASQKVVSISGQIA